MRKLFPILVTAIGVCSAQQPVQFQGIVSGWVQDPPTQSIRIINGMPGAALLGRAVASDLRWSSIAPGSNAKAIAIRNGEAAEAIFLQGANITPVEGLAGSVPQLAAWTPDAKTVVLFWSDSRTAQIVRIDGDGRATAAPQFAIANLPERAQETDQKTGGIASVAAGPDAFYFTLTGVAGIYKANLENDAAAELIAPAVDASTLAVGAGKIWTIDRTSHSLLEIPMVGGDANSVFSDADVLSDISAVQVSTDRKALYLANASTRRLYRLDLTSKLVDGTPAELDAVAAMIEPLARPAMFLLGVRKSGEEPVYIWDEASGNVFFVPNGGDSN